MKLTRRALLKRLPLAALAGGFFIHVRGQQASAVWATGNPTIDKPREIALALLKPTQAQIERAWALHFASVVFESYGFAPRFAVDGDAINQAMTDGASADEISDLREAMMMNRGAVNERERAEFFDAFRAAGVTCIFQNAGEEGNDPMRLIKRLAHFIETWADPRLAEAVVNEAEQFMLLGGEHRGSLPMFRWNERGTCRQRFESRQAVSVQRPRNAASRACPCSLATLSG